MHKTVKMLERQKYQIFTQSLEKVNSFFYNKGTYKSAV